MARVGKIGAVIGLKPPLIVVRRAYYEAFVAGRKTVEYRRHRRPFIKSTFYPGRIVRLAYNYNIKAFPSRLAVVRAFDVLPAASVRIELLSDYPDLTSTDEIALIRLELVEN